MKPITLKSAKKYVTHTRLRHDYIMPVRTMRGSIRSDQDNKEVLQRILPKTGREATKQSRPPANRKEVPTLRSNEAARSIHANQASSFKVL
jgi:hypothetical protein